MTNVKITFRPLDGSWISDGKDTYEWCRFRVPYGKTIADLKHEMGRIGVNECIIELDLAEDDIRLDGLPRANARPNLPCVRIIFDHPDIGPLQYPCDTYSDWHDNVRAIVKTMEAQRAMERYGATRRQQQYTGWRALPPGGATMQQVMTSEEAARYIGGISGVPSQDIHSDPAIFKDAYRLAAAISHPDRTGDNAEFVKLQEARRVLIKHFGLI